MKFAKLTEPNGIPVWVVPSTVSIVRPPSLGEVAGQARTVLVFGTHIQAVRETPSDVMALLDSASEK